MNTFRYPNVLLIYAANGFGHYPGGSIRNEKGE